MGPPTNQNQLVVIGLAAIAVAGLIFIWRQQQLQEEKGSSESSSSTNKGKSVKSVDNDSKSRSFDNSSQATAKTTNISKGIAGSAGTSSSTGKKLDDENKMDEKVLHAKIEELDKRGKVFFKNKQFLEAAQAFTEALGFIESNADHSDPTPSTSLNKQIVTLINNRSAMYEKGGFPELSLEDCNKILEVYDLAHTKARTRKLRILESFEAFYEALVEVCALQLLYMQQNRDKLRMGIPASSPPPVPQSKLEELVGKILPQKLDEYEVILKSKKRDALPSDYTLMQLLKSYTGYNAWMAKAARAGNADLLQNELAGIPQNSEPSTLADRASALLKLGRRHVYDGQYDMGRDVILQAYDAVKDEKQARALMVDDDYARLLEWTGMVKHWLYDLDGAEKCYQECAELEPINSEILVKQAGVAMDASKQDEALKLFAKALEIDPDAVDALLHRANLRMLQAKLDEAQADLERCVELRPDHVLAHLRLAAVLTSKNDPAGAKKHLEMAERADPDSSEVQSYRGELCFTQNDFETAKTFFEKATKLEPKNPTPYVNSALAVLNTPPEPSQQLGMALEACALLQKAIDVDPQFQAAYVQLGQLKLGMAADLTSARDVVELYEKGLGYCRTKEEMKELCSMKILTQAQVDAAAALKMESFSMQ